MKRTKTVKLKLKSYPIGIMPLHKVFCKAATDYLEKRFKKTFSKVYHTIYTEMSSHKSKPSKASIYLREGDNMKLWRVIYFKVVR